jgi:hypothetical protein
MATEEEEAIKNAGTSLPSLRNLLDKSKTSMRNESNPHALNRKNPTNAKKAMPGRKP